MGPAESAQHRAIAEVVDLWADGVAVIEDGGAVAVAVGRTVGGTLHVDAQVVERGPAPAVGVARDMS